MHTRHFVSLFALASMLFTEANLCAGDHLLVGLDRYYNRETRDGKPYHYAWEDTSPAGYSQLEALIKGLGARTISIHEPASKQSLAAVSAYMIVAPNTPQKVQAPNYIEDDASKAIADWVHEGGVLVMLHNNRGNAEFEHTNKLAGRFGIRFNEDTRFGIDADPAKLQMHSFPDHPFFQGVKTLHMRSICTLSVEPPAEAVYQFEGDAIMALCKYGRGTVFTLGDPWGYNEYIDFFDNRVALTNVFRWLLAQAQEPSDQRMAWWREARFGMFIHWGLYCVPAGTWNGKRIDNIGEWIMNTAKIPVNDYEKLATEFNPVKFNADQWVSLAKNAGMKYIVITSKHHDGFAMFHSQASGYNVYDATPFHRDPLQELAEACRKQDMKLGFYYSQAQDWHHPGGAACGGHWDKAQDGDMDQYIKSIAAPQVKELLTNYGPLAVLWWDTPQDMTQQRADLLWPLLKLQPAIITNDRLGGGYLGDTNTPEQVIPDTGFPGRDWETCMTMNDTWGYKAYDNNWKSAETLIRNLADIASKGGNYLLNVGPTSAGLIPPPSVERLAEVGQWMKVNGEAIYGTTASPFVKLPWGRCTQKPGRLYLHVFDWPHGELVVPRLKSRVEKAYLLADAAKAALPTSVADDSVVVKVPTAAPDKFDSVVVLDTQP